MYIAGADKLFQVPEDTSAIHAQRIIDRILLEGDIIVSRKRRYDTNRFANHWENGPEVWNNLISSCRIFFIRFVNIADKYIPELIDAAVGVPVKRTTDAYNDVYGKVKEWRKNWFASYIKGASSLLDELHKKHPFLLSIPVKSGYHDLKAAFSGHYSWTHIHLLFHPIFAGTIEWKETLQSPKVKSLYLNVFTYTMV